MREETNNWLRQAEADFRKSEILFKNNEFDGSVFFSQQTVEKSLKALCLFKLRELPKGHSIIYLAKKVSVPKELFSGIIDLNPEYLITRYPDIAGGIPSELYDKHIAQRHKEVSDKVLKWVKNQIQK